MCRNSLWLVCGLAGHPGRHIGRSLGKVGAGGGAGRRAPRPPGGHGLTALCSACHQLTPSRAVHPAHHFTHPALNLKVALYRYYTQHSPGIVSDGLHLAIGMDNSWYKYVWSILLMSMHC